jgi:hypothetical protein
MPAPRRYPQELRERAMRLVAEARDEDPGLSLTAAVKRIGGGRRFTRTRSMSLLAVWAETTCSWCARRAGSRVAQKVTATATVNHHVSRSGGRPMGRAQPVVPVLAMTGPAPQRDAPAGPASRRAARSRMRPEWLWPHPRLLLRWEDDCGGQDERGGACSAYVSAGAAQLTATAVAQTSGSS